MRTGTRDETHPALLFASPGHTEAWPLKLDVEVHTEDTRGGVILDTQINVLGDAKAEVS